MGTPAVGKVVAFVTRQRPAGPELLVIDHPSAGVQVPAGTLQTNEDSLVGALREAWEETGLGHLRLVERLGEQVESRAGDDWGRLAASVDIGGRVFGPGYPATVLDRRLRELLVEVEGQCDWVPIEVFSDGVVRYFFHFASDVETADEWWVITPDGDGLCWRCRWTPLSDLRLVAGQHEWLELAGTRLASTAARQPAPRPRAVIDANLRNATTLELFWAPPFGGRWTLRSWLRPDEVQAPEAAQRALGVCFTLDRRVVLVSSEGRSPLNHPGGGREPGESLEQALRREVYEEACAHVLKNTLVGFDRFVEIDGAGNVLSVNHQARFAARVALEPFVARHERTGRTLVDPEDVAALLPTWQPESLRRLLDVAYQASTEAGWMVVELATARSALTLRELTVADANDYYSIINRNRQHLTRHGDYAGMATITFEQVTESLTRPTDNNTRFGIWLDSRLIGRVDLNPLDPPNYVLGIWLDEAAMGLGHATEACRAALAFARSDLRATDVWAGVTHGNERSTALLGRLGFEKVAELDRHSRFRLPLAATEA